tara:strand:- start:538 stop:1062 length:525 start_codon:yes stop_codon:yes gene_type:complete
MNKEEITLLKERLNTLYKLVSKYYGSIALTGSCAVALLTNKYMEDSLKDLNVPNDIDFIVEDKYNVIDAKWIGEYERIQENSERSCTFEDRRDPNFKFDLISTKKMCSFETIDGINVILPTHLKRCYSVDPFNDENRSDTDKNKYNILSKIIESVESVEEIPTKKFKKSIFDDI